MATLEKQTGVRLFHRNTRQFSLTEDGVTLYDQVMPLVTEIESCIEDLTAQHRNPAGKIRVNLPNSFAMEFVMPHIPEFLREHPDIELDLVFDDKSLNLVEDGFDIGISNRINEDSRLVVRKLYDIQSGLFVSRQYKESIGVPESLQELKHHNCIAHRSLTSGKRIPWPLIVDGHQDLFTPSGNLSVSSVNSIKIALEKSVGIACIGQLHIAKELKLGNIVPILKEHWPLPKPIWIYYSSRKNVPKRIRVFIDFLLSTLPISF